MGHWPISNSGAGELEASADVPSELSLSRPRAGPDRDDYPGQAHKPVAAVSLDPRWPSAPGLAEREAKGITGRSRSPGALTAANRGGSRSCMEWRRSLLHEAAPPLIRKWEPKLGVEVAGHELRWQVLRRRGTIAVEGLMWVLQNLRSEGTDRGRRARRGRLSGF